MIGQKLFYGRRKGRTLSPLKTHLLQANAVRFDVDYFKQSQNFSAYFESVTRQHFDRFCLEIGFGHGEHLIAQAVQNPDVGFLGCEAFINGVAATLEQIEALNLKNICIYPDPIQNLLGVLPQNLMHQIFILFPDPWPKARHAARRLMQPQFLQQLDQILTTDGQITFASDDALYVQQVQEALTAVPQLIQKECLQNPPIGWPVITRYQQKALDQGKVCQYLTIGKSRL